MGERVEEAVIKTQRHGDTKIIPLKIFRLCASVSLWLHLSTEMLEESIRFPDKIDIGYKGRLVAQKHLDETHVLRVVYETTQEKIRVVTAYPGRRSRYEKD